MLPATLPSRFREFPAMPPSWYGGAPDWRGPSRDGVPMIATVRNRSPGPSEGATLRGDRATAPVQDIQCEKFRGCSYRRRGASYSMSACLDSDQIPQAQRTDAMCQKPTLRSVFLLHREYFRRVRTAG